MRTRPACLIFSVLVLAAGTFCPAQAFKETFFPGIVAPVSMPIQASDGNIYELVFTGQGQGAGNTVDELSSGGVASTFYTFASGTVAYSLLQGADGNLYGIDTVTTAGSNDPYGVFRLTLAGVLTQIYTFSEGGGSMPPSLIQGMDGNLYGICNACNGTELYRLSLSGSFSLVYVAPMGGALGTTLVQGEDGNFYTAIATNLDDFDYIAGYIYRIKPDGSFSTLFTGSPTAPVSADLTTGPGGALYGVFTPFTYGTSQSTLFSVLLSGQYQSVNIYNATATGALLYAGDGNFYGASTNLNSNSENPYVVQITPAGKATAIASFIDSYNHADIAPNTPLLEANNGSLYGGAFWYPSGGENPQDEGELYRLTPPSPLPAPVQLTLSPANVQPGENVTLTWNAVNATSGSLQYCFASGAWSGVQNYSGSMTVSQSATGTYTYALTCGGVETGLATLTVGNGATSTIAATLAKNPVPEGQAASFTVTVSGAGATPTGTVQLVANGHAAPPVELSSGKAALTIPTAGIAPGSYPYIVSYNGDSTYAGSATAGTLTISDGQSPTTTALTTANPNLVQGGTFSLTATVTPSYGAAPGGTASLYEENIANGASTLLLTSPVNTGAAAFRGNVGNLPVGDYYVYAIYNGTAADATSTSPLLHLTVSQSTSVTMTASPNPIVEGNYIQLEATVTPASAGNIEYRVNGTVVAQGNAGVPLNVSTAGVPPGTYAVLAYYVGGQFSLPSVSPPVSVTVVPKGSVVGRR